MLIKWSFFVSAILALLISVEAFKYSEDLDIDDVIEPKTSCIDGQCFRGSKEVEQESTEETTHKQKDELQPNQIDLVKLLSLLTNNESREKTKITFNVRDIQSGFHNRGSKYHVGNIHREQNRDKRDTESVLEDTTNNEDGETGLVLTTETLNNYVQTGDRSKELVVLTTTENYQVNNDNTSVDVNVVRAEADNFQDSNVIDNYDSVANGSTTISVDNNEKYDLKMGNNNSNAQVVNIEPSNAESNDKLNNETVMLISNNTDGFLNNSGNTWISTTESDFLGIENEIADDETVIDENFLQSQTNQTQLPKVKIALSRKDLNKIQNALSDDLGIKSKGANPVANFSLNGPLGKTNDNPVVVLVYNCSCGNKDTHTHNNDTEQDVVGIDETNNNFENVFNTRRMMSNNEPIYASLQTEVTSEVTIPDNTLKVYNTPKVDDKANNALLENELLQKCNSLLSLQQTNKANKVSEMILDSLGNESLSLNQANIEITQKLPSGISNKNDNNYNDTKISQTNDTSNSDTLIIAENLETENNSATLNNGTAVKQTPVDNISSNSQLQINNVANDSQADSNIDIANQAVTLVSENLNTAVNIEDSNLSTVVKETLYSKRKRRSITKDANSLLQTRNVYRKKRGVADVIKDFFEFTIVPNNSTEDSAEKSNLQTKEKEERRNHSDHKSNSVKDGKVIKESKHDERKKRRVRSELLNTHRNKRNTRNIIDYIHKLYGIKPNNSTDDYKYSNDGPIKTKREIKSSRNPKYYDYTNDGVNLLDPNSNSNEYDGTIINLKSLNDDATVLDHNIKAVKQKNNDNTLLLYKDNLASHNEGITSNDLSKLLSIKPVYINVYLQLLMNNFGKDQKNDT